METKRLIKEFIKVYNYGPCIMYGVEKHDLYVLFKHWTFVNWSHAPKVYLGKVKSIKNLNPTYVWQD